jgi:hypothetical protein
MGSRSIWQGRWASCYLKVNEGVPTTIMKSLLGQGWLVIMGFLISLYVARTQTKFRSFLISISRHHTCFLEKINNNKRATFSKLRGPLKISKLT